MYYNTWLTIRYKSDMSSFRAVRHDTIQWLDIYIVTYFIYLFILFAKNWLKENAYFYTMVEEVNHWKSLMHWTTQAFSARSLLSLCGPNTQTENLSLSVLLVRRCWRNTHAQGVREWTGVQFTTLYHYECEKYIHNNVWAAIYTKALILSINTMEFCF